jgi:sodium-dependent dicarboxylate transporter 2/3/5
MADTGSDSVGLTQISSNSTTKNGTEVNQVQPSRDVIIEELQSVEVSHRTVSRWQLLRAAKPGIITVLTPLVFLPIPIIFMTKSARCAYVILIMSVYWATEVIPTSITALLPIAVMPWLGVAASREICPNYFDDANVMYFSGLMLALAVERWNLHKRIALRVLLLMGSKPIWIMFGFMTITAFLSMWISNTGATAMIIPIAVAILDELAICQQHHSATHDGKPVVNIKYKDNVVHPEADEANDVDKLKAAKRREFKEFSAALTLSIALAANIGGTATLIGCAPNITLAGLAEKLFGPNTGVNFISWLSFAFPTMLINLLLSWLVLSFLFLGVRNVVESLNCCRKNSVDDESHNVANAVFRREYNNLGPMSFAEGSVMFMFGTTVLLWITRKPYVFPGWSSLLDNNFASEASVGITVCVLLFLWPSRLPNNLCFRRNADQTVPISTPSLLDWQTVHKNLPWSVVLLLGGGFALAFCCKTSGLSTDLSSFLSILHRLPDWIVLLILSVLATICSTLVGIIPTGSIFIPIVAEMGESLHINPLALMISVAFASSFCYTLPVSTPPNAIVYAYSRFTLLDMVKSGLVLSIVHILVLQLAIASWGRLIYHLNVFPDWAEPHNSTLTVFT